MKTAIEIIADQYLAIRRYQANIEKVHMAFDCTFDSVAVEAKYVELGEVAKDLEMFICRGGEEAATKFYSYVYESSKAEEAA